MKITKNFIDKLIKEVADKVDGEYLGADKAKRLYTFRAGDRIARLMITWDDSGKTTNIELAGYCSSATVDLANPRFFTYLLDFINLVLDRVRKADIEIVFKPETYAHNPHADPGGRFHARNRMYKKER